MFSLASIEELLCVTPIYSWLKSKVMTSPLPAAEMSRKNPLFPGDSELQQLLHIFK